VVAGNVTTAPEFKHSIDFENFLGCLEIDFHTFSESSLDFDR
jgi:hypothetical protein